MTFWVDANLPPALARWLASEFPGVEAYSAQHLGLLRADDEAFFLAAREANAVILTKDADLAQLVKRLGTPPHVIWLRTGNGSTDHVKQVLGLHLSGALALIRDGEPLVEIRDGAAPMEGERPAV